MRAQDPKRTTAALKRLMNLDNDYLLCRDIRHVWELADVHKGATISTGQTVMQRRLSCGRCGTERLDTYLYPSYDRVSSDYRYPDGYGLQGRVPNTEVRRETFKRFKKVFAGKAKG